MIFNVCLKFTRTYALVKLTNFSMEMLRSVHIQSFVLACYNNRLIMMHSSK